MTTSAHPLAQLRKLLLIIIRLEGLTPRIKDELRRADWHGKTRADEKIGKELTGLSHSEGSCYNFCAKLFLFSAMPY